MSDTIYDVMWEVETEPELDEWIDELSAIDFAVVPPHVERLAERGNQLRMPATRFLGDGLFELRFEMNRKAWRIPFYFASHRRIVLLTVFHKQRMNEATEVRRARRAMATCMAQQHTAEEDT
jgi:hypothetical protein